jgi:hypothetical protein
MEVVQGSSDRVWNLMWEVPASQPEGPIRISLIAEDGHMISEEGSTPAWVPDGGRTEQRYWLSVSIGGVSDGSNNGDSNNGDSMNANDDDVNFNGEYQLFED